MVCQVRYTEWTRDDRLRHPVFLGIREAKSPTNVVREKEALKKDHELFRLILIKVHPNQELPADQTYSVSVVGVMRGTDHRNSEKLERGASAMAELELLLAECKGIKVEECGLRTDEDVRLSWLDYYVPWDLDYLTFQDLENTVT